MFWTTRSVPTIRLSFGFFSCPLFLYWQLLFPESFLWRGKKRHLAQTVRALALEVFLTPRRVGGEQREGKKVPCLRRVITPAFALGVYQLADAPSVNRQPPLSDKSSANHSAGLKPERLVTAAAACALNDVRQADCAFEPLWYHE